VDVTVSPEIVTIIALVVIFAIATVLPINMGALAFVAAFIVGTQSVGMTTDDILVGFPAELVLTLIGVTYLFAIAQNVFVLQEAGTIDYVGRAVIGLGAPLLVACCWPTSEGWCRPSRRRPRSSALPSHSRCRS
jgi:hypothetical protein